MRVRPGGTQAGLERCGMSGRGRGVGRDLAESRRALARLRRDLAEVEA